MDPIVSILFFFFLLDSLIKQHTGSTLKDLVVKVIKAKCSARRCFYHPSPKVLQDAGSAGLHTLKSRSNAVVSNKDFGH